jgi:G3E family GTPase
MSPARAERVPVIALTGHLGAGKTTVLNRLLRQPGARIGVVVNDFGDINVDAGLVTGQVDEPASIAGGCLCCLPDAGGLDDALAKLTHPRLGLDAVIVEASGLAEPGVLARLIRFTGVARVRPGGVIDVVDAVEHFNTLDRDPRGPAPARFGVASLVVVNKCDRLPDAERQETVRRVTRRVREQNPHAQVVPVTRGHLDPTLVYDVAATEDPPDQLPIGALLRDEHSDNGAGHQHADAVSVTSSDPVEPTRLLELLERPPADAYRIKGRVSVATARGLQRYVVHLVGHSVHVHPAGTATENGSVLVAIGMALNSDAVRRQLQDALAPSSRATARGYRELQRYCTLSL